MQVPKEDREYLRDQRAKVVATGGRFQLGPVDAEHVLAEEKRKQSAEYAVANAESVLKRVKKCYVKIKALPDIVFSEVQNEPHPTSCLIYPPIKLQFKKNIKNHFLFITIHSNNEKKMARKKIIT